MSVDKIFVMLFGAGGIAFTYWFFLMKNEKEVTVSDSVDIIVEGGYSPEVISVPINKTTKINFLRKDPSSCLEEVIIPEFKIKKFLSLNQKLSVEITPQKPGKYEFVCGMNMFHGKIIVK